MTSNLTFIRNEERITPLALDHIGSTLGYSKEDVQLYFFMLAVISEKHPEVEQRNQAFKYLIKQDKLQRILDNLIARHQQLELNSKKEFGNDTEQEKITEEIHQLEQELDIFNELHFRVKRTYIRFTKEHFQVGWGQAYMVA